MEVDKWCDVSEDKNLKIFRLWAFAFRTLEVSTFGIELVSNVCDFNVKFASFGHIEFDTVSFRAIRFDINSADGDLLHICIFVGAARAVNRDFYNNLIQ